MCNASRALIVAALVPIASVSAGSNTSGVGLGVVVGDPTALSLAWRPGDTWYLQAALGWNLNSDRFALNVDYLMTLTTLHSADAGSVSFPIYVGVGGRMRVDDDDWDDWGDDDWDNDEDSSLGLRVPVGLSILPTKIPMDFFVELAPVVELIPATDLDLDAGIGARFYF